jgi:hypothetical protein
MNVLRNRALGAALVVNALVGLCVFAGAARADMGFGPLSWGQLSVEVRVTYQGEPLPEGEFLAVLLIQQRASGGTAPSKEAPSQPGSGAPLPGLDQLLLKRGGGIWVVDDSWRVPTQGQDGWVSFQPIKSESELTVSEKREKHEYDHSHVRLAVYLPGENKWYLTQPIDIRLGRTNYLTADLSANGTGALAQNLPPVWDYFGVWPLFALALTLGIELGVVAIWIWMIRRRGPDRRVLLAWLLGNLFTHPLVWYTASAAQIRTRTPLAFLQVFIAGELAAIIIEAVLYAWLGRLSLRHALGMSFTANAASFLFGCCVVTLS